MILTGTMLEEIGISLYGDVWVSALSKKLRRSKRTIMRWRDSQRGLPMETRRLLLDLVESQIALLAEKRDILASFWDDA